MIKVFLIALTLAASVAFAGPEVVQLGTANTVTLRGEINETSAQTTALELMRLDTLRGEKDYTIYLVLDTPGGSIDAGESLIEVAKTIKNLQTITVFAASMGSAVVEALPGQRLILDSGILMFHRAKGQVGGQFEDGELESRLSFYKAFVRRMELRNASRMGISLLDYKRRIKDEMWLTSNESLNMNAADKVVSVVCSKELSAKREVATIEIFIFSLKVSYSGCPLIRTPDIVKDQPKDAVEAYMKYRRTFSDLSKFKGS